MNKKNTKRSLLLSVLSLLVCCSMLVGSTFAWFTDSVVSGSNVIKSGNLDVEMVWADGTEDLATATWKDASTGAIFNHDLWEPGYTEVRHVKVSNKGSLALQYQFNIEANGEVSKLSDVIDVYFIDPAKQVAARNELTDEYKVGTLTEVLANVNQATSGHLTAGQNTVVTIALKMQESAGNEYQNLGIGSDFSVVLNATQYTYESDSFGDDYDTIEFVNDAASLKAAVEAGKNVVLTSDVKVDANEAIKVANGAKVVMDLNGHTISATSTETGKNRAAFVVNGEMSVVNGTVTFEHKGTNMEWSKLTAPFSVEGGTLTLGKGLTVVNTGGTNMAYAVDVNTTGGETVLNVDGATLYSTYTGVRIFNNHKTATGTVNYNSGVIDGVKRDIWAQNPSASAVDANGVVNIASVFEGTYTMVIQDSSAGRIYTFANETKVVANADGLVEALEAGEDVKLLSNVKIEPASMSNAYGTTGINIKNGQTIDGNGNTLNIKGAGGTWDSGINTTGGLIKNLTVTGSFRGIFINHNSTHSEKVVLENVIIDGTVYTISCDQGSNQGLEATNSTFNGWTSYAKTLGDAKFVNCTFGEGSGYAYCRPYAPTEFVGCEFEAGFTVDPRAAVTFENCTLDGKTLTAENLSTLVTSTTNVTLK